MDIGRFRRLTEAYGAEPAAWPPAERAAALALLGHSLEARRLQLQARRLDAALGAYAVPAASKALEDRILRARPEAPSGLRGPTDIRERVADWLGLSGRLRTLWPQAASLAAACVVGFVVGLGQTSGTEPVDNGEIAVSTLGHLFLAPTAQLDGTSL